jgi:Na+-transporting NADH:ubiquinone oxidoreductase subunit F
MGQVSDIQAILIAVALFTLIVTALAILILIARKWLVASGDIKIEVNGERTLTIPAGDKLLTALSANALFLPSACGGRGTCGQCKVRITEGGREALPIEAACMTKHEIARGERLACQLTVNRNMRIELSEEVFGVKQWECTVRSNNNVSTFIKELLLDLPDGETIDFKAGAYIQIQCPAYKLAFKDIDIPADYRAEWERFDLFSLESVTPKATTRAYSIASCPAENSLIMLNVRIAVPPPTVADAPPGVVSSYMFGLRPGDKVWLAGPFGHFFAKDTQAEMIFIGGGAGMAPMRAHILDQLLRIKTQRKITFWYGARSLREAFYVEEFDKLAEQFANFDWHLVLSEPLANDHWTGLTGFVDDVLLQNYLRDHPAPEDCEYYICGPPLMNSAVMSMLDAQGVDAENIMLDDFSA